MTKETINQKLEEIIKSIGNHENSIVEDRNFFAEKIFDSMEAIDYMIRIDEVFEIEMNMEIIEKFKLGKISDMAEYITSIKN